MSPEYVAKKSALKALTPLLILFFWLIIPLIVIIYNIIKLKNDYIEFYSDKIIQYSGIISKHEKRSTFPGVVGISVNKSIFGRMFNYGDLHIDIVGKWDINTDGIINPDALKNYLENRLVKTADNTVNTLIG